MERLDVLDGIRTALAKANTVTAALFSASSEGACPACNSLGVTYTDLAYMPGVASICEACGGCRFTDDVLEYRLRGARARVIRLVGDGLAANVIAGIEPAPTPAQLDTLIDALISRPAGASRQ